MMSNLNERLREVLDKAYSSGLIDGELKEAYESDDFDSWIAEIRKAFLESDIATPTSRKGKL